MARFYRLFQEVSAEAGERIPLTPANARIARNVLRLAKGDRIALLDGTGHAWEAAVESLGKQRASVTILDQKEYARPWPSLSLIQAFPKGDKSTWIIQKAVEWGVSEILFFSSQHTVARKKAAKDSRWRRVAIEALRQSGNPYLPEILGPLSLEEIFSRSSAKLRIFFDEAEKAQKLRDLLSEPIPASVSLAIGPEGGWSKEERERFQTEGFRSVQLGPYVLRTETAAVGAMASVRALLG